MRNGRGDRLGKNTVNTKNKWAEADKTLEIMSGK